MRGEVRRRGLQGKGWVEGRGMGFGLGWGEG